MSKKDTLLEASELETRLAELNAGALENWTVIDGRLHRRYKFDDFGPAFGFMTQAALVCETMSHHPKWTNVWNVVEIDLLTHRAKGITSLDFELAAAMERIARQYLG